MTYRVGKCITGGRERMNKMTKKENRVFNKSVHRQNLDHPDASLY